MPVSQKAPLKYQGNQDVVLTPTTTYRLPPRKSGTSPTQPTHALDSQSPALKQDLLKTCIIALLIFSLEILVWWKVR